MPATTTTPAGRACLTARATRVRLHLDQHPDAIPTVPPRGTCRRLRGLLSLGHPVDALAEALGWNVEEVVTVMSRSGTRAARVRVDQVQAAQVAELYERWSGTPGPCTRSRQEAMRRHYRPPLWWDDVDTDPDDHQPVTEEGVDELAVELVCAGQMDPGRLTSPADQHEALCRLAWAGHPAWLVAERLRVTTRSVCRARARVRRALLVLVLVRAVADRHAARPRPVDGAAEWGLAA